MTVYSSVAVERLERRIEQLEAQLQTTRQALAEATQALSDASLIVEAEEDDWQVTVYRLLCRQWDIARRALADSESQT
jgi:hypothetical protein